MVIGRTSPAASLAALIAIVLAATASLWHHHDHADSQAQSSSDKSCVVCVAAVQAGPNLSELGPTLILPFEHTGFASIAACIPPATLRADDPRSRGPPHA